jgi:hypothetical protein
MLEVTFLALCALGFFAYCLLAAADATAWLAKDALASLRRRKDVWFPEPHLGEAIDAPVELSLEDSIRLLALAAVLQREAKAG